MMDNTTKTVQTMAEMTQKGVTPEVLFWVGCAGSFDDRSKKITKAFVKLLQDAKVSFAVLGPEESCTGDPAKRSGNEFLFQMQASTNIEVLNGYEVKKIVTACPHCFNTLIEEGRLKVDAKTTYKGKKITFHDPCYLGRANKEYEAPRALIEKLNAKLVEMKSCKEKGLCCGAGGAQMFKDAEKGDKEVNIERTEQALDTKPEIIAAGCPFCNTMLHDGVKNKGKEGKVAVLDVAQLLAQTESL